MIIEDLQLILLILEKGSFSEAGKELSMTQSAVSKRVSNVENEFGVPLFERMSRSGVRPTNELLRLENQIRELVNNYEDIFDKITERKQEIVLSSSTGFRKDILLKLLESSLNEDFVFSLSIEDSETIVEKITNNNINCGFIGYPLKQKNIICKKIYDQRIVLAGTKEIENFEPENIYDIPIILQQKGSGLRRFVMEQLKKMGIDTDKINTPIEAGYEEFGKQASLKGLGYTFIPEEDTKPPLKIIWKNEYLTRSFWQITKKEEISKKISKMLGKILRGD